LAPKLLTAQSEENIPDSFQQPERKWPYSNTIIPQVVMGPLAQ